MLCCRAEHEPSVAFGDEVDRVARWLEDCNLPAGNRRGGPEEAFVHSYPRHGVSFRRMICPTLSGPQAYGKVRHRWRHDRALRTAIFPEDHPSGTLDGDVIGHHVTTGVGCVLQFWRQ